MSNGGLIQLNSIGKQDQLISGNPDFSYFQKVHKKHTNFAMESQLFIINNVGPGTTQSVEITRNGDLINNISLVLKTPAITGKNLDYFEDENKNTKIGWVKKLGHALIESVKFNIGGSEIDKHYGTWMDIWHELTCYYSKESGYNEMIGNIPELTELRGRKYPNDKNEIVIPSKHLTIPFQFWFCRYTEMSIPIIALAYHQVVVEFEIAKVEKLFNWSGINHPQVSEIIFKDVAILVNYVYLHKNERIYFAKHVHDYLIEKIQFSKVQRLVSDSEHETFSSTFDLTMLNHPTKELLWVTKVGAFCGESNRKRSRFLAYTHTDNWDNAIYSAAKSLALSSIIITNKDIIKSNMGEWENVIFDSPVVDNSIGNASYIDSNGTEWEFTIKNSSDNEIKEDIEQPIKININSLIKNNVSLMSFIDYVNIIIRVDDVDEDTGVIQSVNIDEETIMINNDFIEFNDDDLIMVKNRLTLDDISIPVDDFKDTRVNKLTSINSYNKRDVSIVQMDNYGLRLDGKGNSLHKLRLVMGGYDRFREQGDYYFNSVQPYNHHSRTPVDGINVYSFCINPEKIEPSGTANFSRFDTVKLMHDFKDNLRENNEIKLNYVKDSQTYIYALSYNLLRITGGMGALAFGN